jgi:hypothetical protein
MAHVDAQEFDRSLCDLRNEGVSFYALVEALEVEG